jgi:hypothetical protein
MTGQCSARLGDFRSFSLAMSLGTCASGNFALGGRTIVLENASFAGVMPACRDWLRFPSGPCKSAHGFDPRFLSKAVAFPRVGYTSFALVTLRLGLHWKEYAYVASHSIKKNPRPWIAGFLSPRLPHWNGFFVTE